MTLLISHMTALDFWRKAYPCNRMPNAADATPARSLERALLENGCTKTEESAWSIAPPFITPSLLAPEHGILHLTVQGERDRNRSRTLRCHRWSGAFPEGSFYQFSGSAFVASPEFVFLQMSHMLTSAQLIALGNELCGLYSLDETRLAGVRQRSIPLVTPKQLASFLDRASDLTDIPHGLRKAQRAVEHIAANSASPRETATEMLLALPCHMGGYGLPRPVMNHEIALPADAASIARRQSLRADLWWAKEKIDLEFNGAAVHSESSAVLSDRARTNALMLMGITTIEITSQQLNSLGSFESIALHLAKLLGKRVKTAQRGPLPQRLALRDALFTWNGAFGRPASRRAAS